MADLTYLQWKCAWLLQQWNEQTKYILVCLFSRWLQTKLTAEPIVTVIVRCLAIKMCISCITYIHINTTSSLHYFRLSEASVLTLQRKHDGKGKNTAKQDYLPLLQNLASTTASTTPTENTVHATAFFDQITPFLTFSGMRNHFLKIEKLLLDRVDVSIIREEQVSQSMWMINWPSVAGTAAVEVLTMWWHSGWPASAGTCCLLSACSPPWAATGGLSCDRERRRMKISCVENCWKKNVHMPALQLCLASPDQCPEKSTNASQYLHHIISLTCSKPATVPHRSALSLCMFEDKKIMLKTYWDSSMKRITVINSSEDTSADQGLSCVSRKVTVNGTESAQR